MVLGLNVFIELVSWIIANQFKTINFSQPRQVFYCLLVLVIIAYVSIHLQRVAAYFGCKELKQTVLFHALVPLSLR